MHRLTSKAARRPDFVPSPGVDLAVAFAIVSAATLITIALFATFGATRIGVVFLTAVMLAGASRGMVSSVAAAILANPVLQLLPRGSAAGLPASDAGRDPQPCPVLHRGRDHRRPDEPDQGQ